MEFGQAVRSNQRAPHDEATLLNECLTEAFLHACQYDSDRHRLYLLYLAGHLCRDDLHHVEIFRDWGSHDQTYHAQSRPGLGLGRAKTDHDADLSVRWLPVGPYQVDEIPVGAVRVPV